MIDFILKHFETIGGIFGVIYICGFFLVFKGFPEFRDNKWMDLWGITIYGLGIIGSIYTFSSIFKWFLK